MQAIIIIIGGEVLNGETLDTNSKLIGQSLNEAGIQVIKKITVPDEKKAMVRALDDAGSEAELVIITGGLGPTNDDLTRKVLSEYFNSGLVFHPEIFEHIKSLLKNRFPQLTKLNEEQAMIPACAIPVHNRLGTAAGMWIEKSGRIYIAMPGIPYETEAMFSEQVIPLLKNRSAKEDTVVVNKNIRTIGAPESYLAAQIKDIEDSLPENIKLAYLPHLGQVKLRLSAYGKNRSKQEKILMSFVEAITNRLGGYVYGFDDEELPACIGRLLKESHATLSLAESCTGGFISHLITTIPGSSEYFKSSLIAYSNEVKMKELGVPEKTLLSSGAVSEETAVAMAVGSLKKFNTNYSLATTGIAGPGGGSENKPVGTFWFAAANKDKVIARTLVFDRGRFQNIQFFSVSALNLLRKLILKMD